MITSREIEVFLKRKQGLSFTSIALELGINQSAVSRFYKKILEKIENLKKDNYFFLSRREKEVLELSKEGKTQKEIASLLGISQPVVSEYYRTAVRKINSAKETLAIVGGDQQ